MNYHLYLIIILFKGVIGNFAANSQRVCSPSKNELPYSGYRVDLQVVNFQSIEFHLYMCKDGRVLEDIVVPTNSSNSLADIHIPWTTELCNRAKTNCVKLARRKTFALRNLPLYFPGTSIGALFWKNKDHQPPLPLIAENTWDNQWIEMNGIFHRMVILHIPLLYTPGIDNRKHPLNSVGEQDWFKNILPNEDYNYKFDPRFISQKIWDSVCKLIEQKSNRNLLNGIWKDKLHSTKNPFLQIIFLSKILPQKIFIALVKDIDKIYSRFTY
ncbi:hypothetical protein CAAN1_04S00804 [[Candida] anglica]|uniref:Uncharacterized protein n=1 Tax=[Candida] anglica TaxID=148631 RepID=A0ABP0E974_9ASCO